MEKKPVSYFLVGIVLGLVSIILFLGYYFTGLAYERNFVAWIPTLVSIGLLIYFVTQYSKANGYNLTFGGLFSYGFRSTIIWTLIVVVFMFLVLYIFPEYKVKFMEQMNTQMDQRSNLSEAQRDAAIKMTEKFFNVSVIGGGLFMNMLIGTIGSLIGAAVAKKNPVSPFNQTV